jgi:hypothetical protein
MTILMLFSFLFLIGLFLLWKLLLYFISSESAGITVSYRISPLLFRILTLFVIVAAMICRRKICLMKAFVVGSLVYSILMVISGSVFCLLGEKILGGVSTDQNLETNMMGDDKS